MSESDSSSNAGSVDASRDRACQRPDEPSWCDLLVEPIEVPPEKQATLTLGAWQRQHGVTAWCAEAKVYFATLVVQEAQRRVLLERLDNISRFLAVGATPDQAMARILGLVDEFYGCVHECTDCDKGMAA